MVMIPGNDGDDGDGYNDDADNMVRGSRAAAGNAIMCLVLCRFLQSGL